MLYIDIIIIIIGFILLIKGADYTVNLSENIAFKYKIQPFIIGALAIGIGTGLPEIVSSVISSLEHKNDFIISNVIGSMMFNITFILGFTLMLVKKNLIVKRDLFYKDSTWIFAPLIIFLIMVYSDGVVDRIDGVILLFIMVAFIISLYKNKNESIEIIDDIDKSSKLYQMILKLIASITILIAGAYIVIYFSSDIAKLFGISDWIIGMFIIGVGTSLPEMIVSLIALKKKNGDLVVGNIIGSNVANISLVIGIPALINPITIDITNNLNDIIYTIVASIVFFTIIINKLYNQSGGLLLLIIFSLFLKSTIFSIIH